MKMQQFPIVITQDEDGMLMAQAPTLPGCHTQAKDLPTLYKRMQEAVELYLEVQKSKKIKISHDKLFGFHQLEVAI